MTWNRLLIRWSSLEDKLVFNETTYTHLIDNFKKSGYFNDANDCYYYFREKNSGNLKDFGYWLDTLYWLTSGYGVKYIRPIISFLVILGIFAIIYWSMDTKKIDTKEIHTLNRDESGRIQGKEVEIKIIETKGKLSLIEAIRFSLVMLLSGTGMIYKEPPKDILFYSFNDIIYLEKLLGLILFTLFLITLANTILIPAIK